MLFDYCNYVDKAIGPNTYPSWEVFNPATSVECGGPGGWDWADFATDFRQTADAFLAAIFNYINTTTSIPCNNALCSVGPISIVTLTPRVYSPAAFNDFYQLLQVFRNKTDDLYTHLDDVLMNPTTVVFNQAYYDDMLTAFNNVICGFKTLMKIHDNDNFLNY